MDSKILQIGNLMTWKMYDYITVKTAKYAALLLQKLLISLQICKYAIIVSSPKT